MKRNKVKKCFALLLAGALAASSLSACGEKEESKSEGEKGTTLSMAWWGNQVRNERTQEVLDKYHEENPEVTIEGQFFQWADYWNKMATSAAGGNMTDLLQMDISAITQYVEKEQLLDLTPYIESGALDVSNVPENVLMMGEVNGGNYGIAAGVNSPCLFYNKTLTDELGITVKDNMTYDEFVEIAKQVTEETGYRAKVFYDGYMIKEWLRGEGIEVPADRMPVDSAEDYVPYFKMLEDGVKEGYIITPDVIEGFNVEQDPMIYGSGPETMAWCTMNGGSNLYSAFEAAAPEGMEIGVTTMPTANPKLSNYLKPAMFWSISADTEYPDEAVEVLNYLINSEEANNILLSERGVPASTVISEAIYDKLTPGEQVAMDFVNNVVAKNCSPMSPPDPDGTSEWSDTLKKAQEKIGYGEMTAEEAAKEYFTKGTEIFSKIEK